jgi:hypothetical protein
MLSISKRYIGRETERQRHRDTERQKVKETKRETETHNRIPYFGVSVQASPSGFAD